jgi:hypothetical protein
MGFVTAEGSMSIEDSDEEPCLTADESDAADSHVRWIGLRWDGTISAGNLMTTLALAASLLTWGVRLEERVTQEQDMRTGLEQRLDRAGIEQQQNDLEIKAGLRHLDDKITALLVGQRTRLGLNERDQ